MSAVDLRARQKRPFTAIRDARAPGVIPLHAWRRVVGVARPLLDRFAHVAARHTPCRPLRPRLLACLGSARRSFGPPRARRLSASGGTWRHRPTRRGSHPYRDHRSAPRGRALSRRLQRVRAARLRRGEGAAAHAGSQLGVDVPWPRARAETPPRRSGVLSSHLRSRAARAAPQPLHARGAGRVGERIARLAHPPEQRRDPALRDEPLAPPRSGRERCGAPPPAWRPRTPPVSGRRALRRVCVAVQSPKSPSRSWASAWARSRGSAPGGQTG